MSNNDIQNFKDKKRKDVVRLDNIGWGLFLIVLGVIWLFPDKLVPEGTFLFFVGIILLGMNLIKYMKGLRTNGFTIFLGIIAIIAGLCAFLGRPVSIFPLILILWGLSILIQIIFKKKRISEKND
ncbi:MAG: hypothetical protein H8E11_01985 [Candidatus Cloacimonetes bacterium]|nr:hypothetical protein [Candidatus Cloacimonadota bacterium]